MHSDLDPTPWVVRGIEKARGGGFSIVPESPDVSGGGVCHGTPHELDNVCARVESKETAERIVACVNACDGLDDETVAAIPSLVALVMVRLAAQPSVKNEIERFIMPPKAEA